MWVVFANLRTIELKIDFNFSCTARWVLSQLFNRCSLYWDVEDRRSFLIICWIGNFPWLSRRPWPSLWRLIGIFPNAKIVLLTSSNYKKSISAAANIFVGYPLLPSRVAPRQSCYAIPKLIDRSFTFVDDLDERLTAQLSAWIICNWAETRRIFEQPSFSRKVFNNMLG